VFRAVFRAFLLRCVPLLLLAGVRQAALGNAGCVTPSMLSRAIASRHE
jgi:hypothetical protein